MDIYQDRYDDLIRTESAYNCLTLALIDELKLSSTHELTFNYGCLDKVVFILKSLERDRCKNRREELLNKERCELIRDNGLDD